mgnify:CR=1 FL=1
MAKPDAAERIAQSFSALEIPGGLYAGELKLLAARIRRELRKAFRAGRSSMYFEERGDTEASESIAAKYGVKL